MGKSKTRELERGSFRAAIVPGSINEEKRTVDVIWSTGAKVLRGFFNPFFEELSMKPSHVRMDRLKSGKAPLLNTHRSGSVDDVIGVVEKASLKKGEGFATLRFSEDQDADKVFQKVVERIVTNVSVGYETFKAEEVKAKHDDEDESRIPTFRAIDWEPFELSMVPVGADAGASVRNHAQTNPCEFIFADDTEQRTMADKTPVATPAAPQQVAPSAPVVPAPAEVTAAPDPTPEQTRAIQVADRQRTSAIQRCARTLGVSEEVAQAAVVDGTSLDKFQADAVEDYGERNKTKIPDDARPDITGGDDVKDKMYRGMTAWLITRCGKRQVMEAAAKKRGESCDFDPGEFRGMTLLDICRETLKANGQKYRGMDPREMAGDALSFRSGGHSGISDFPNILENVMNKLLLGAYAITPDMWTRFCATGSVSDFRAHNRYRLGSFGALETVNEHGEFRNVSIPDAGKESITAATVGNIIMLSRQAIINDDMDAFSKLSTQIGRSAKLTIEVAVFLELAKNGGLGPLMSDGKSLFHADHNNISAGAAMTTAAIEADRLIMKAQTDESSNDILDLVPKILLIPANLAATARQINESEFDIDDVGGLAINTSRGLYSDIIDTARLSGTRRYSFADTASAAVLEVAFLNGEQEPFIEMQEGFRVDGVSWKVRLDFGVAGIDVKGAVTDAGA